MIKETFYHLHTGVSIALVADTHNHPVDEVLSSLRNRRPKMICIAGDFVYARLPEEGLKMENSPYSLELLKECSGIAPTFVSVGNHEWMLNDRDMEIIHSTNVWFLNNSYVRCRYGQKQLVIGGLSSAEHMAYKNYCASLPEKDRDPDVIYPPLRPRSPELLNHQPELKWLDEFCAQPGYKILLCHHPEYYPRYLKDKSIDLILSGHAHGGQIRLFGQGLFAPGQGVLPRLTSGVVDGKMVISRGLANNTVIPRLFNHEEIVYVTP